MRVKGQIFWQVGDEFRVRVAPAYAGELACPHQGSYKCLSEEVNI